MAADPSPQLSGMYKANGTDCTGNCCPEWIESSCTSYVLDPIRGAFNIGCMIRWLDYNDTWLAAEWGHPSDNLGGILAVADYISRVRVQKEKNR